MQALSQLSYGPALLRAGNHSDIFTSWEVVYAKSCTEQAMSSVRRAARPYPWSAKIEPQGSAPAVRLDQP
ncbi:hypothetical protein NX08_010920 [Xanthomonas vasicola]|nr:hypothetical protein NX08_010920 [Xanthomonas vasicola]